MSDDLENRGGIDRKLISLKEPHEVRYWTTALGISKEKIEQLVAQVGHSAEKVRAQLEQTK